MCHSAVFGAVAARAGIVLDDALTGYLQAFAANLVAAGLRLGIIGPGGQGSNLLRAMALANALAILPDGSGVEAGADVETMLLG